MYQIHLTKYHRDQYTRAHTRTWAEFLSGSGTNLFCAPDLPTEKRDPSGSHAECPPVHDGPLLLLAFPDQIRHPESSLDLFFFSCTDHQVLSIPASKTLKSQLDSLKPFLPLDHHQDSPSPDPPQTLFSEHS